MLYPISLSLCKPLSYQFSIEVYKDMHLAKGFIVGEELGRSTSNLFSDYEFAKLFKDDTDFNVLLYGHQKKVTNHLIPSKFTTCEETELSVSSNWNNIELCSRDWNISLGSFPNLLSNFIGEVGVPHLWINRVDQSSREVGVLCFSGQVFRCLKGWRWISRRKKSYFLCLWSSSCSKCDKSNLQSVVVKDREGGGLRGFLMKCLFTYAWAGFAKPSKVNPL